jgi:hypothetical protein
MTTASLVPGSLVNGEVSPLKLEFTLNTVFEAGYKIKLSFPKQTEVYNGNG